MMNHKLLSNQITKNLELHEECKDTLWEFMHLHKIITQIEQITNNATTIAKASISSHDGTYLCYTKI